MWTAPGGEPIPHVQMAAAADLIIVAPLSANTLAKLALGLADNLLTSTLLATPIRPVGREAGPRLNREEHEACRGCWRRRWNRTCGATR